MSRRQRQRNTIPATQAPQPPTLNQPPKEVGGTQRESWWSNTLSAAVIGGLVSAVVAPIATQVVADYRETRAKSQLVFASTETVLSNGKVIDASLINIGSTPASEVVVTIEAAPTTFEFNPDHVHTNPAVPFETVSKKGRLEVRLKSPLGQNQLVNITIDQIPLEKVSKSMFLVWATSHTGLADRQGHEIRHYPDMTLDQFVARYGPTGSTNDRQRP